jgi:hypothetical protein
VILVRGMIVRLDSLTASTVERLPSKFDTCRHAFLSRPAIALGAQMCNHGMQRSSPMSRDLFPRAFEESSHERGIFHPVFVDHR